VEEKLRAGIRRLRAVIGRVIDVRRQDGIMARGIGIGDSQQLWWEMDNEAGQLFSNSK